jgi:hypothetical protein
MHLVRRRPLRRAETQHDVRGDQPGEKHNFRRKEQPQAELAAAEGQRRLILQRNVPMSVIV